MLFVEKRATVLAWRVQTSEDAARLVYGGRETPLREGEDWAVEWDFPRYDGTTFVLRLGGARDDYLVSIGNNQYRSEPPAKFEVRWEPSP